MREKLPSYGGQALIEEVVIRGTNTVAAAMRDPNNKLVVQSEDLTGIYSSPFRKIPFLRGLWILWDSLGLGYKFLTISANLQAKNEDEKLGTGGFVTTFILSMSIAILLFMVAPATAAGWLERQTGWSPFVTNLLEGFFRLFLLVLYLVGIGQMQEIKRVFGYHGAEHKTINAYEAGIEMVPKSVMKCSIQHPRCGTSFLLTLVIFSIILFSLIGPLSLSSRILSRFFSSQFWHPFLMNT